MHFLRMELPYKHTQKKKKNVITIHTNKEQEKEKLKKLLHIDDLFVYKK